MKGDTEVLMMVAFFFGGVAFNAYISDETVSQILTLLVAPAATLVAAYAGSRSAFALQHELARTTEERRRRTALNLAIFEISRVYDTFLNFESRFISPYRDDPDSYWKIKPSVGLNVDPARFTFPDLAFIFDSVNPNLLGKLSMLQRNTASTLAIILDRSQHVVEYLQPALARALHVGGDNLSSKLIDFELGALQGARLEETTRLMIKGIDDICEKCPKLIEELIDAGKELLPGMQFLAVAEAGTNGETPAHLGPALSDTELPVK